MSVVALNGEVDFSRFNALMLGVITRQRAALSEVDADGIGTIGNLEPGTYTIVAISFPADPSAMEALEGDAMRDFMQNLHASSAELITIETDSGEIGIELYF